MFDLHSILICILLTFLGQFAHLGMVKIPAMIQNGKAANHPFSFSEWICYDWIRILGVFAFAVGAEIVLEKMAGAKPAWDVWKWLAYFFWGFMLSSIVQQRYGIYEKKITDIIDRKTDIADGKIPTPDQS